MNADERIHLRVNASHIIAIGISDRGLLRPENEDCIYIDKSGHFMLVADGMGGHERGAEASKTALDIIKDFLHPEAIAERLRDMVSEEGIPSRIVCLYALAEEAVEKANTFLYERNQELGLARYMGTTVVGLVPVENKYILWFHVGDSRLYLWRDSVLKCLTVDHSAYAEWINHGRLGEEPGKNIITRAIGPNKAVVSDIAWDKWMKDDTLILCSDGVTDMITDEKIEDILHTETNVDDIATGLINSAIDAGGKDNTSVIVCKT